LFVTVAVTNSNAQSAQKLIDAKNAQYQSIGHSNSKPAQIVTSGSNGPLTTANKSADATTNTKSVMAVVPTTNPDKNASVGNHQPNALGAAKVAQNNGVVNSYQNVISP